MEKWLLQGNSWTPGLSAEAIDPEAPRFYVNEAHLRILKPEPEGIHLIYHTCRGLAGWQALGSFYSAALF